LEAAGKDRVVFRLEISCFFNARLKLSQSPAEFLLTSGQLFHTISPFCVCLSIAHNHPDGYQLKMFRMFQSVSPSTRSAIYQVDWDRH
jgi:hypothetical protein